MNAQGIVLQPDERLPDRTARPSPGFAGIFGFLDGVRGVSDRVEGITGDVTGIFENVTDARRAVFELDRDKDIHEQNQQLQFLKVNRGDNVKMYYVIGAAAVALILLTAR